MAETAFATVYRDEWIAGFERDSSSLRSCVTTEAMVRGRQAVFLVATAGREAVTRGANGMIPSTADNLSQQTVTLAEAHDLPQKTDFNIVTGQSDQRAIMQAESRKVINRHIDDIIIAQANTTSVIANATASIFTKQMANIGLTKLYNGQIPNDGQLFGLLTPAAWAHLSDIPDFANSQYVGATPLVEGAPAQQATMKRWLGVNWMIHTALPNAGTATARCFVFHKNALGWAYAGDEVQALAGFNEEQAYSWARTTIYDGALLLQGTGVVRFNHDDSQYS